MQCNECSHENRSEARFCEQCGAALERVCQVCGTPVRAGAKFCDNCGTPLPSEAPPPSESKSEPQADAAVASERRRVTVLFADAVGYTPIAESLDEEEVYNLMQGCVATMQETVERHGGSVNQYTGDGILALFGAPVAYEDSARRAVAAALEMQRRLGEYSKTVRERHEITCQYRVGLNTGPVVVGRISDNLDLDYAAVGDTVNLAARMQTLADPGAVFVTESTYQATRDFFDFESLGAMPVKGKSEPVAVYRAVRERPIQHRLEASKARGFTPYVGRAEEQRLLAGLFEKATLGHGQVVLLLGEAGMGKSRALYEFQRQVGNGRVRWLEGQCVSYRESIPYLPALSLVKDAFDIKETDSDDAVVQKLERGTESWDPAARRTVPYLKYLLNVDPGDPSLRDMAPLERRAGFLDAFRALLQQSAQSNPVVLVLEDVHWIDPESENILHVILDVVPAAQVLIVLTARPGYVPPFGERGYFTRVSLGELKPNETAELVKRVLDADDVAAPFLAWLNEKTEGNPFYVEEVTRSLLDQGLLERVGPACHVRCALEELPVPGSIHEVILARIDRLHAHSKIALQRASVIGREFPARLLGRLCSDLADLEGALADLKAHELIYEKTYFPELVYVFKHALTHEVAYSTLLKEHRRARHRAVAEGIETLYADRLQEHYEELAHHYELGEAWEQAYRYYRKSGEKAQEAYANPQAIEYYSRALAMLDRSERPPLNKVYLLQQRALVSNIVGDFASAISDYTTVANIARDAGDVHAEALALAYRAQFEWQNHDFDASIRTAKQAIELARDRDASAEFGATAVLWFTLTSTGDLHEAETHLPRLHELATKTDNPLFLAIWGTEYAIYEYWAGNFDSALQHLDAWQHRAPKMINEQVGAEWIRGLIHCGRGEYQRALEVLSADVAFCRRIGEVFYRIRALNTVGWVYNEIQNFDQALRWNEEGVEAAVEAPTLDSEVEINARLNLADTLICLGRLDEAAEQLQRIEPIITNPQPHDRMSHWTYSQHYFHTLGELHLARQEPEDAASCATACLDLARETKRLKNEVKGLRLLGQSAAIRGDHAEALQRLREAVEKCSDLKNPTQSWLSLAALGHTLTAAEHDDEAREAFAEAAGIIETIAANLDPGNRDIFLNAPRVSQVRDIARQAAADG